MVVLSNLTYLFGSLFEEVNDVMEVEVNLDQVVTYDVYVELVIMGPLELCRFVLFFVLLLMNFNL